MLYSLAIALLAGSVLSAQLAPNRAVKSLKAAEGIEATLWASEPMLANPTNIDVDARGRIWVLEAVNYRRKLKNLPDIAKLGDRILILEDTDGDGRADKRTVFDQNLDLRSPLGIAVLGDKVIVSQSPNILVYTKDASDNILDKKVLLSGFGGADHDHGVHSVLFGPDGRYWWNVGDQGFNLTDSSGKRWVSSREGPYYAGAILRMSPNGAGLHVFAHNFRNPFELAIDSFGTVWQADNDDDGNAWTRMLEVMKGGNYGYWGPGGRSWRADKGTHFHQENPGVAPAIARTGAGSPAGITVYEGQILPEKYRGQILHADAGKRVINAYRMVPEGAGYRMETEVVLSSPDSWFRPTDVAVGPGGAVFIADWYDSGVGGHNMADAARGRIYRLAPPAYKAYNPPAEFDIATSLAAGLASPAQSIRYLAFTRIREMGEQALPWVRGMWAQREDVILQARALWLVGVMGGPKSSEITEALKDEDPRMRMLGLRVLDLAGGDVAESGLEKDPSPLVRRELAVLLQGKPDSTAVLAELANRWDGQDRWYLEALGIAAKGREDALYARLRDALPGKWNPKLAKLLWELRPPDALPAVVAAVNDAQLVSSQRKEALETLIAFSQRDAARATADLIANADAPLTLRQQALEALSKRLLSEWMPYRNDPALAAAIRKAFADEKLQSAAAALTDDLEDPAYAPDLLALARNAKAPEETRALAVQALGRTKDERYFADLDRFALAGPLRVRSAAVRAIGFAQPGAAPLKWQRIVTGTSPNEVRSEAVRALARSDRGLGMLLDLEARGQLPADLKPLTTSLAHQTRNPQLLTRARALLPVTPARTSKHHPQPKALLAMTGDPERGRRFFSLKGGPDCANCHSLDGKRQLAGPHLTHIATKYGKDGLLETLLNPSAAIAPEYSYWTFDTKTMGTVSGTIGVDTPQRVTLRTDTGEELRFKPSEITARRQSKLSMMPDDLPTRATEQQIADLLAFLVTLK